MHAAGAQVSRQETQVLGRGTFEQRAAGVDGERRVVAERAGPVRLKHLHRIVDRISTEHQALIFAGCKLEADLARCMTRQRENPAAVHDLVASPYGLEQFSPLASMGKIRALNSPRSITGRTLSLKLP